MKRIGIDIDGTVADYIATAAPLIEETYGLTYNPNLKCGRLEELFGINREQLKDLKNTLYVGQRLFEKLGPLEHDNHLLTFYLRKELKPIKIYFVTARDPHPVIVNGTREWLNNNTHDYDDIFHVEDKAAFCKQAGISVMIEDDERHLVKLLDSGIHCVVMDQVWNRSFKPEPGENKGTLRRAYNWREAYVAAKELLQ